MKGDSYMNNHRVWCSINGWPGGKCNCDYRDPMLSLEAADPPSTPDIHGFTVISEKPLTRREQFAMAAMQGLLASHKIHTDTPNRMIAEDSVRLADALIEELDRGMDND
jgi:hypothetical protein